MSKNGRGYSMSSEKISSVQFMYIIVVLIVTTADMFPPSIVAVLSGRDAWAAVLISTVIALFMIYVFIKLGDMHKDKTLMEYAVDLLGRVLGRLTGLLYAGYFIYLNSIALRELGEMLKSAFLIKTPITVILITASIVMCYGVYCGFEAITRVIELGFFMGMGLLAFVIIFSIPMADFYEYLPAFENGIMPSLKGALVLLSYFGESALILMIYPAISNKDKAMPAGLLAVLLLGLILESGTIAIAVFGPIATSKILFPALQLVRMINYAEYFQRLDAIILALWVVGIMLKLLLLLNTANACVCQLGGLKDPKPTIIPLGLLVLSLSELFFDNVSDVYYYLMRSYPYSLFISAGIPLLLFIVSFLKGYKFKRTPGT
ncbi:GerAB/ArcD/ProY family transporter [Caldanaerobius polysaccharolyticus]|uniref:GerAB/ArcD/ProY family transporter n=1 Tax=Caldanaerobius polysaccharolyticus TaxID=44256 RepID=UPI0004789C9B|nr:endospore germination permease [Caldanaerobius polysaccharolyticus]